MKTLIAMVAAAFSLLMTAKTAQAQELEWAKRIERNYVGHVIEGGSAFSNANASGTTAVLILVGVVLTITGGWLVYRRKNLLLSTAILFIGLVITALGMRPTGLHFHILPHAHWLWVVPIVVLWGITKWIKFTDWDDRAFNALMVIATLFVLALRGMFGSFSPATPVWWVIMLVWVVAIAEAIWSGFETRPTVKTILLTIGWYLVAVLA